MSSYGFFEELEFLENQKIRSLLQRAVTAHQNDAIALAEELYKDVLKIDRLNIDANHNLGVLYFNANNSVDALKHLKLAISNDAPVIQHYITYLNVLAETDDFEMIETELARSLSHTLTPKEITQLKNHVEQLRAIRATPEDPNETELETAKRDFNNQNYNAAILEVTELEKKYPNSKVINNFLGACYGGLGELEKAITHYDIAIAIEPNFIDCRFNKGVALYALRKYPQAISAFEKVLELDELYSEAHYNLGNVLVDTLDFDNAISHFQRVLVINKQHFNAANNLALVFSSRGNKDAAINYLQYAIEINPNSYEAHSNLGNIYNSMYEFTKSLFHYEKALKINPNNSDTLNNLGLLYHNHARYDKAENYYQLALSKSKNNSKIWNNLGVLYKNFGEIENARHCFYTAIKIDKNFSEAYRNLSELIDFSAEPELLHIIQEQATSDIISDVDKYNFEFCLAKAKDNLGEYESAFDLYLKGNDRKKRLLNYDISQDKELFKKIINFTPLLDDTIGPSKRNNVGKIPIFIVGMPRSGTTLLEQMISAHSKVFGAGELPTAEQWAMRFILNNVQCNSKTLQQFRQEYFNQIIVVETTDLYFTDKMPSNFRFINFILKAIPEAKIIHIQRDKYQTCWSNFMQCYSTEALGFSYNLNDLFEYYEMYEDLMKNWNNQYKHKMLDVVYDDLIQISEDQLRKIFEFIGINFEAQCLSPEKNKRVVKTASQIQIREKTKTYNLSKWKNYEAIVNRYVGSLKQ